MAIPDPINFIYYRYYSWKTKRLVKRLKQIKYNSFKKWVGRRPLPMPDCFGRSLDLVLFILSLPFIFINWLWSRGSKSAFIQINWEKPLVREIILFFIGIACGWAYFGMGLLIQTADSKLLSICSIWMLAIMSFGMAFWDQMRIVVLLAVPLLFSRQFRLIIYAIIVIKVINGPAANVQYNAHVLVDTFTCQASAGKIHLKEYGDDLSESLKYQLEEFFWEMTEPLREYGYKLMDFARSIRTGAHYAWEGIKAWCTATLKTLIGISYISPGSMIIASVIPRNCDILIDRIIESMVRSTEERAAYLRSEYVPDVTNTNASYSYEANGLINYARVFKAVTQELADELEWTRYFSWLAHIPVFFIPLYILARSAWYFNRYHYREDYDNRYINEELIKVDIRRHKVSKETALPLLVSERRAYIDPKSIWMSKGEFTSLIINLFIMVIFTWSAILYLVADHYLWWALKQYRELRHGVNYEVDLSPPNITYVYPQNDMISAKIKNTSLPTSAGDIWNSFKNKSSHCVAPLEFEPDTGLNREIYILLAVAVITCVLEAYMLRMRHVILNHINPKQSEKRAKWLCNNIIQARGSFQRFMKYQIMLRLGTKKIEKIPFIYRIQAISPVFAFLRRITGYKHKYCTNCGRQGPIDDFEDFKHCKSTENCSGLYCLSCLQEIENICTVCSHPVEVYLDSDVSEELDSSDEDSDYYDSDYCDDTERIKNLPVLYRMKRMMRKTIREDDGALMVPVHDAELNETRQYPLSKNYHVDEDEQLLEVSDEDEPLLNRDLRNDRGQMLVDMDSLTAMRQKAHQQLDSLHQR